MPADTPPTGPEGLKDNPDRLARTAAQLTSLSRVLAAAGSLLYRAGLLALIVTVGIAGLLYTKGLWTAPAAHQVVRHVDMPQLAEALPPIAWEEVDAAVAEAAAKARVGAESSAADKLDLWKTQLLARIDGDFLPWYFGYWNQQAIGLQATWQGVKYQLAGYVTAGDTPSPAQQLAADIQREFANRVLHPQSAQLFLEQLTRETTDRYLADLRQGLAHVQTTYRIPQPAWDRYLQDIAVTTLHVEAARSAPLTLKALTASSVGAGAILAAHLARMTGGLHARLSTAAADKAGAKVAANVVSRLAVGTTGKTLAKTGSRMLGPAVAAGIVVWDLWDHHCTVSRNSPILRESLAEYLTLLGESLLRDPQTGVASAIHQIDTAIVQAVGKKHPQTALANMDY